VKFETVKESKVATSTRISQSRKTKLWRETSLKHARPTLKNGEEIDEEIDAEASFYISPSFNVEELCTNL